MKNIIFYISDHGFGHASRNAPIIKRMLEQEKEINIIVKASKPQADFINSYVDDNRVEYYYEKTDLGLVLQEGSLLVDKERLICEVNRFIASFDERIEKEIEFLKKRKIDKAVVDIVPWALIATKKCNIKSILISNFTWVDIYKEYLDDSICNKFIETYKLADSVIMYDLAIENMKAYLNKYLNVGLVCREFNKLKIKKIKEQHNKPIVFVSVGRSVQLKDIIDVSRMDYDFIVTDGIKLKGDNVYYLPINISNTQDYIAASEYVISKAGWGTSAEILLANKKCALLARDSVAEDRNTINILQKRNQCLKVDVSELNDMEKVIKGIKSLKGSYEIYKNDDKRIASIILE